MAESRLDVLIEMQQALYMVQSMGVTVIFSWVPAHIEIMGNEMADRIAKRATKKEGIESKVGICQKEVKNTIKCT